MRMIIGPHLPLLRRYARALTGSQRSGDAYVRLTLEALLASPKDFQMNNVDASEQSDGMAQTGDTASPKLQLFRLFHSVAQGTEVIGPGSLQPGSMEALLLIEVEGFTLEEAASILDTTPNIVADNVQKAKTAISAAIRSRVLIIEDEPLIALHLEQIVEDMGHEVSGMAITHAEAILRADEVIPELVLADIQLADGSSGLDAAREILEKFDVPVIFITAFPERLLTGERPEPTFLVTKPFKVETVVATIGQALLARSFAAAEAG